MHSVPPNPTLFRLSMIFPAAEWMNITIWVHHNRNVGLFFG
jgi:hypothetical protein